MLYLCCMMLLALALLGQQTECKTIGDTTRCEATAPVDAAPVAEAPQQAASAILAGAEGAKGRRAVAYAQVGQLIADNRCADALRLARFYGQKDIVRDTERACH